MKVGFVLQLEVGECDIRNIILKGVRDGSRIFETEKDSSGG